MLIHNGIPLGLIPGVRIDESPCGQLFNMTRQRLAWRRAEANTVLMWGMLILSALLA